MTLRALAFRDQDALRHGATLVIGLGNPILGDDGVGWRVAEDVARRIGSSKPDNGAGAVEVECFALGGLSLMERMVGYKHAVVVDAITTGAPAGTVRALSLDELGALPDSAYVHATAVHDTSLPNALRLGREIGAPLPERVDVVGIEAASLYEFSEQLTPAVAGAVPIAVEHVLALVSGAAPISPDMAQSKERTMISPELLRRYPFFGFVTDAQVRALAMISEEVNVEAGESVFEPDTPANALYLFVQGSLDEVFVVIDRDDPHLKKEFFLSEMNPGDVIGLQSLVPPYVHSVAARATARSLLVKVDSVALRALCEADADFARGLMTQLATAAMVKLNDAHAQLAAARA